MSLSNEFAQEKIINKQCDIELVTGGVVKGRVAKIANDVIIVMKHVEGREFEDKAIVAIGHIVCIEPKEGGAKTNEN